MTSLNLKHGIQPIALKLLAALLFSGLLSLTFLDGRLYGLTWIAFIPLLYAIHNSTPLATYFLGLFSGFFLFLSVTYWVADFINLATGNRGATNLGLAIFYWLYCAHVLALPLVVLNWLRRNIQLSDFLVFPVLLVSCSSLLPMVFSMRLGDTQVEFKVALQAIEFFGVYALDAVIALTNIMLFHVGLAVFSNNRSSKKKSAMPWVAGSLVVALWFCYGGFAYHSWENEIRDWETMNVGIVQPNEVPSRAVKLPDPGYSLSYPPEMEMTERLASAGAEIVIWPEARQKYYFDNENVAKAYQHSIRQIGVSLVFQDSEILSAGNSEKKPSRYNSAAILNSEGVQTGLYRKMKRIPFGEYIPLLNDTSYLSTWLRNYLGSFYSDLSAGDEHQLFEHSKIYIVPLICYETTIPEFVASAVKHATSSTNNGRGTVLVGLTNDGWFGSIHQAKQHVMPSVLRAIENRRPLIHVVNNGPSIVVTPHGQVTFKTPHQHAGGYIAEVSYSQATQGSFYSRHPTIFTTALYFLMLTVVTIAIKNKIRPRVKTEA